MGYQEENDVLRSAVMELSSKVPTPSSSTLPSRNNSVLPSSSSTSSAAPMMVPPGVVSSISHKDNGTGQHDNNGVASPLYPLPSMPPPPDDNSALPAPVPSPSSSNVSLTQQQQVVALLAERKQRNPVKGTTNLI
jgi:hypothetical protein